MTTRKKTALFFNFALAALLGIAAGVPLMLQADDTEIYIGTNVLAGATRSNVLFILDTSGSMSGKDGTGISRLDRMKDALDQLLDKINNVNVGLMRFTKPGGPILYPISYIDESTSAVEGKVTSDVSVSIASSSDDAQEIRCIDTGLGCSIFDPDVGKMTLTNPKIDLVRVQSFGTSTAVEYQVDYDRDDAERIVGGSYDWSDDRVELRNQGGNVYVGGFRFRNVALPPGAIITHAELDFRARKDNTETTELTIYGHDVATSPRFPTSKGTDDPADRLAAATSAKVTWTNVPDFAKGDRYQSPELKSIVQELVDAPTWASGEPMTFLVTASNGSRRRVSTRDDGSSRGAILRIEYGTSPTNGIQRAGLRFQNVQIPQGVKIDSATLEFVPSADSSDQLDLRIYGDATVNAAGDLDAATFTTTDFDLSNRTETNADEQWELKTSDPWTAESSVQSPNLKDIVQEIVDDSRWCGGNAMAFALMWDGTDGPRPVYGFDGDQAKAPVLRIDYDEASLATLAPGEGCIVQEIQAQIKIGSDDAEQRTDSNTVSTSGKTLELTKLGGSKVQTVGLRFQKLDLQQGTEILGASIEFTASGSDSGATTLTFYGEDTDDAGKFSTGSGTDVKSRFKTTASQSWSVPAWSKDERYTSPDLAAIVKEIVDRSGWAAGNDMAFILTGSGLREARSFDKDPARSAVLRVRVKGVVGSNTASTLGTVRQRLKEIIIDLDNKGGTPIVDTLYEAALYFRGEGVLYGTTRNNNSNTRVSHPASYAGGTVFRESGCTDDDLNNSKCKTERIDGSPVYISPIEAQVCQSNYIVLLTDGQANNNNSVSLIENMSGVPTCKGKFADGSNVDSGEECGVELVKYLQENDQSNVDGKNTISTYTIGFNFSGQFLRELAAEGGGDFFEASSADELVTVFETILDDVQTRTTSFATPALSVNAFNKLFHRNEVYFSLFKPTRQTAWDGNVKKYQLCNNTTVTGCTLGEVMDDSAPPVPAIGPDERIDDNARSFWGATIDGPAILEGGAGNQTPAYVTRNVYTYTGGALPADLSTGAHVVKDSNTALTKTLLGNSGMPGSERTDLINWMRGQDVDDFDVDGDNTDQRYSFSDPLHSSPVAVTYGGSEADPIIKLFVGTNDGGLRMINASTGVEEWIFYPQMMLEKQSVLRANPKQDHEYGVDGTPTIWLNDENYDGIIDPGVDVNGDGVYESVTIFFGLRRGGMSYYALDATPTIALSSATTVGGVNPTLLWRIDGGSGDFAQLGQTWSQPKLTSIKMGTNMVGASVYKKVLVFAGGYNDGQDSSGNTPDSGFGPGGPGNAIYVVDPDDGSRLFWISADDGGGTQGVVVPDMTYPIPSDLALIDGDGDGATDRFYVGDTGGQLWRIDIGAELSTSAGFKATVGKLATVSDASEPADQRKFFYPPDVVQVSGGTYSSVGRYDLVTAVTGNRANPLNQTVQDRLYAFRDAHVAPLVDGDPTDTSDDDGLADGYALLQGKTVALPGDLFDVTDINGPQGADLTSLQNANGYFIDLEASGEKALAPPVILAGTIFFTSYKPEGIIQLSDCSLAEGGGDLYALNVLNGAAAYNWDGIGDDTNLSKSDRTYTLGAGIPSGAVPIFQEEGITILVGGGGGATTIDPNLALPRARTYWGQEQ